MLEKTGIGSVVIIDDEYTLLGIVTDGDIRRAILSKENDIRKIINFHPKTWSYARSIKQGINHMRHVRKDVLPVTNDEGKLVDVLCLDEISFEVVPNPVVIMAGGLGTRLQPLTNNTPKPMLPINGKPILERIIEKLISQGFQEFYISINYLGEQVRDYFGDGSKWDVSIRYIEENKRLGTAGALYKIKDIIKMPFVVMNGDVLTDLDFKSLLSNHQKYASLATMCVYRQTYQIPFGVVTFDSDKHIVSMQEKPLNEYYVNMGIYSISPEILAHIPHDEFFDMPTLFQKVLDSGGVASVYDFDGLWNDIGRIEDYQSVNIIN